MDNYNPNNPNWPFPPRTVGSIYYGPPKTIGPWSYDAFWDVVFPFIFLVALRFVMCWIAERNGLNLRGYNYDAGIPPDEIIYLFEDIIEHLICDPDEDDD